MNDTINIDLDIPTSEYDFLKMICDYKGIKIKDFIIQSLIGAIEDAEDEIFAQKAKQCINSRR